MPRLYWIYCVVASSPVLALSYGCSIPALCCIIVPNKTALHCHILIVLYLPVSSQPYASALPYSVLCQLPWLSRTCPAAFVCFVLRRVPLHPPMGLIIRPVHLASEGSDEEDTGQRALGGAAAQDVLTDFDSLCEDVTASGQSLYVSYTNCAQAVISFEPCIRACWDAIAAPDHSVLVPESVGVGSGLSISAGRDLIEARLEAHKVRQDAEVQVFKCVARRFATECQNHRELSGLATLRKGLDANGLHEIFRHLVGFFESTSARYLEGVPKCPRHACPHCWPVSEVGG